MQIKWAIKSPFLNGIYLLWWVNNLIAVRGDKTTCRPSIQTSEGLHFICYCDTTFAEVDTDSKDHLTVDLKDDSNGKMIIEYNELRKLMTTRNCIISPKRFYKYFMDCAKDNERDNFLY